MRSLVSTSVRKANGRRARDQLEEALRRFEPRIAKAFREAIRSVRSRASLRLLAEAIERGDLDAALEIVGAERLADAMRGSGIEPDRPSVQDELFAAFLAGGSAGMAQLPRRLAIEASLNLTNPEALRYLNEHVPSLIREVSQETQRAVQQALLRGFTEGRPARMIAREVRQTVGLTQSMEHYVSNFRRALETGTLVQNETLPWQRRLSATERQQARAMFNAARNGSPAAQARIDALVDRYRDSLVNRRSRNIARTEATRAFGEGQNELWRQAQQRGLLDPTTTRRVWIWTNDGRGRDTHQAVVQMNPNGVGLNEPFQTPIGPVMGPRQSGDPSFDVNCRCTVALEFDE